MCMFGMNYYILRVDDENPSKHKHTQDYYTSNEISMDLNQIYRNLLKVQNKIFCSLLINVWIALSQFTIIAQK